MTKINGHIERPARIDNGTPSLIPEKAEETSTPSAKIVVADLKKRLSLLEDSGKKSKDAVSLKESLQATIIELEKILNDPDLDMLSGEIS